MLPRDSFAPWFHGLGVGQYSGPLDLDQAWKILYGLERAFHDLPTMPGYVDPGWRVLFELKDSGVFSEASGWEPAIEFFVRLYDETGDQIGGSFPVWIRENEASADDLVLLTMAQTQQAISYAATAAGAGEAWVVPLELPSLAEVFGDVGPDEFANLVALVILAGL